MPCPLGLLLVDAFAHRSNGLGSALCRLAFPLVIRSRVPTHRLLYLDLHLHRSFPQEAVNRHFKILDSKLIL